MAASVVMCMGAGLQAGAVNADMFIASRFVLGFGIPFAIVNASSLIAELAYARERPILTSLFNASWFVGAIVAAGVTYGTFQMTSTWAWRLPSILQLVPSMCQLCFMPFCPESPRWLMSRDRADEALVILQKYHTEGDHGDEFVRLEFAQIQSTIAQEQTMAKNFVWADVLRDAPMRRRFFLAAVMGFFTQWSGNGLLSFYMKKILNLVGIEDDRTVQKVILSNTCWGFINAVCGKPPLSPDKRPGHALTRNIIGSHCPHRSSVQTARHVPNLHHRNRRRIHSLDRCIGSVQHREHVAGRYRCPRLHICVLPVRLFHLFLVSLII